MENRPEERDALETQGRLALEDASRHEPRDAVHGLHPLLRLWHYPSFYAYTSWTVFEPPDHAHARLARQVQLDRPHDLARFSNPLEGVRQGFHAPPTITVRDGRVTDALLQRHLQALRRLPIPVVGIDGPWGVDGETFGVQLYGDFLNTQIAWWGDGPGEWSAFTAEVTRLRTLLAERCR